MPRAARDELERLGGRWRTLPLDQALRAAPKLRSLAQSYARESAPPEGLPITIPDLGPATAYDQLVVLTYDVARCRSAAGQARIVEELAELRRHIARP